MKKLFVAIIFSIFLISSVSAFGNVALFDKDYQDNNGNHYAYGHYKVKNNWNIPIISSTVADYTLIYNTDKCNIGNECKAIGEAILYEDGSLFESVDFVDKDGLSKELESHQWYISNHTEEKQQLVCEFGEKCYLENYTDDVWDEYNYEVLPAGTYKWKLSGYKKENILIDWIATANSATLIEWADWDVGEWTNLSTTDTAGWVGTSYVFGVAVNPNNNLVYTGIGSGKFGVYNRTSNVWTDLSATDAGNWVATSYVYRIAINPNNNLVYTGIAAGKFGVYNETSNVWTDLSATDTAGWVGSDAINDIAVNPNNNLVYTVLVSNSGKFGVYNETSNVWTDLSATDPGNWVGTGDVFSVAVNPNNNLVYTGIGTGKFGVYNRTSNVWTDLSATDTGNWVATSATYGVTINPNNNLVYTGIGTGKFGVYNRTSNVWTNLSTTDAGNWLGSTQINDVSFSSNSNLIYVGAEAGKFGVYNPSTNILSDLSATDTGNWVNTSIIEKLSINNNLVYTTLEAGKFGVYVESIASLTINNSIPINNSNTLSSSITFGCNATSTVQNITSIVLNVTGTATWTQTISGLNTASYNATFINSTLSDGSYSWNCIGYGSGGVNASSAIWTFSKDTTAPSLSFVSPTQDSGVTLVQNYIEVNATASDAIVGLSNIQIRFYNSAKTLIRTNNSATSPFYVNLSGLSDGIYYYNMTANDTLNNINNSVTRNITLNTGAPVINYVLPTQDDGVYKSQNYVEINVTGTDSIAISNLQTRLYNSTGSQINISNSATSPLYMKTSGLADATYYYNATVNNTAGTETEAGTRSIVLDTIKPLVNIIYPIAINYSINVSVLNYTTSDINLDSCWYSLNNGVTNTTITCGTNKTGLISAEGSNTWKVYANDSAGNQNVSSVTFFKDTIYPMVNITYPMNNFNYSFNITALNYTFIEANPTNCWYSLDSGVTNTSVTCGINLTGLISNQGSNVWEVYVNDTLGQINKSSVTFSVDSILPIVNITSPNGFQGIKVLNLILSNSYQETADVISYIGSWTTPTNAYDGNWGTYGASSLGIGYVYFNYTKPIGATTNSVWQVKDYNAQANLSIPASCWDYDNNKLMLQFQSIYTGTDGYWSCYDGTWKQLRANTGTYGNRIYEEAMVWEIGARETSYNLSLNYTATDTNLDSCWYNLDNGINVSLSSCNNATINMTDLTSTHITTLFANDTYGNVAYSSLGWTVILNNGVAYSSRVFSADTTTIIGNFTIPVGLTNVYFNYYNQSYAPSSNINGENYLFTNSILVPDTGIQLNVSFNYIFTLNGNNITSSPLYQIVEPITISTDCSTNPYVILNLENYDEDLLTLMSGTVEYLFNLIGATTQLSSINGNMTGTNFSVCSNIDLSTFATKYSLELRYYKSDGNYFYETYNVENAPTLSLPITIPLYFLNRSSGVQFKINYVDFDYLKHPGAIIQMQRQYLAENVYRVIEIPKIGDDGQAVGSFNTNNLRYKLIVIDDGIVLDTFDNIFPSCQNIVLGTCEVNIRGEETLAISVADDFAYTLVKSNNSLTLTFVIPSGTPKIINFKTSQSSRFLDNITTCDTTLPPASGGTIICSFNDTIGDSIVSTTVSADNIPSLYGQVTIAEDLSGFYLLNNYFIAFILLLTLGLIFISSGAIMVVVAAIGFVFLGLIFLIKGASLTTIASSLIWFIIAAIIVIYKISQKEERT